MNERDDWHLTDDIDYERGSGDPFAAAVRATRMPMVITDPSKPDNPIVFCNEAFERLSGYTRDEIIGVNCRFLQGPDTDRDTVRRIHDAIAAGHAINVDLLNYRKDGTPFWNALYLSPVRGRAGDIQFFFASQLDVTDRVETQRMIAEQKAIVEREVLVRTAELTKALETKTILLHEVDHRVKNNLTMIGSLLRLQARSIRDPDVVAKLGKMLERVDALAAVHRRLYQNEDIRRFDVGAFVANLATDVVGAAGRDGGITLDIATEELLVTSESAAALGLLLNEILTNAVKHGFADGRTGTLTVRATCADAGRQVVIADDGPGMPDAASMQPGLGSILVDRLSRQVGAKVTVDSSPNGTRVSLTLPVSA